MKCYFKVVGFAKRQKGKYYLSWLLLTLASLVGIAPYVFFAGLAEDLVLGKNIEPKSLVLVVTAVATALIVKNVLFAWGLDCSHNVAYHALENIRKAIAAKIMRLSIGSIESEGRGRIKKLFVETTEDIELVLAHGIPEGFGNMISVAVGLGALFWLDFRLALLLCLNLLIANFALYFVMLSGNRLLADYYKASEDMNATLIDYVNGMEVIKVFNSTGRNFKKYGDSIRHYRDYAAAWTESINFKLAVINVCHDMPLLFVLPGAAWFYHKGSLSLHRLILASLISLSLIFPLRRILEFMPGIAVLGEKSKNIFAFLSLPELKESEGSQLKLAGETADFDVSFENVSFSYMRDSGEKHLGNEKTGEKTEGEIELKAETATVSEISFVVKPASLTALVGPSGSGKSTLMKLLLRFWDCDSGAIRIGGVNIADVPVEELMAAISYVSQDNFFFDMSIRENLLIGNPDASEAELLAALKAANAYDFVMAFENGLDEAAGRGGRKLSGGELQRLTIARALLKNSPILILDEATSFADPENEELIQQGLNRLIRGKTVFVIAHRLTSVRNADQIILLDQGRLAAKGRHEELMRTSPLYAKLYALSEQSLRWDLATEAKGGGTKEVTHD